MASILRRGYRKSRGIGGGNGSRGRSLSNQEQKEILLSYQPSIQINKNAKIISIPQTSNKTSHNKIGLHNKRVKKLLKCKKKD